MTDPQTQGILDRLEILERRLSDVVNALLAEQVLDRLDALEEIVADEKVVLADD